MKYLKYKSNKSGIALIAAIISVVSFTTVVGFSFFGLFGKDEEKENKTSEIRTKIEQDINKLNLPDDREGIFDFEIEPILKKYGTINYSWTGKIKSITTPDGTKINIGDLYSGKIIKSTIRDQYEGGQYNIKAELETPELGKDMLGVYWSDGKKNSEGKYIASDTSTKKEVTSDSIFFSWSEWYNYLQTNSNGKNIDIKLNRWANAKSKEDGSYFVWIPRFEYKIEKEHVKNAKNIDINFISTSQTTPSDGYKIHPAFTNGNGNYDKGQWDKEISGFWIAKYEMSMEISKNNKKWNSINANYIKTSNQGNILTSQNPRTVDNEEVYIRTVSKPNCYAWNYISISNAYANSKNYDTENQSHLIKNSEWGAVAYLAHSQYGRNSNKIGENTYSYDLNDAKYTGFGSEKQTVTSNITNNNRYNGKYGRNASTTGNLYGVYDMSGGNYEYTAGFFSTHENIKKYGNELYKETKGNFVSTKYVTVYKGEKASITECYDLWEDIYGDAIYETSRRTGYYRAWQSSNMDADYSKDEPFFIRGGTSSDKEQASIFSVNDNTGIKFYNNNGFRVVLIVK